MDRFWFAFYVGWLVVCSSVVVAVAQEDEEPVYRPGLVASFTQRDSTTNRSTSVSRVDEDVQFVWNAQGPDPRLAATNDWQGRWQGRLFTIVPGPYRLHFFLAGRVTVSVVGQTVLEADSPEPRWFDAQAVDLTYGHHPLVIEYTPSGNNARLGLYWSGPQFALEPVPERHLFHEPTQTPTRQFAEGRLLAKGMQCVRCHDHARAVSPAPGPDLTHLVGQIFPEWIVARLTAQPPAVDNSAGVLNRASHMPYFAMPEADAQAITAWLMAVSEPAPRSPPSPTAAAKSMVKSSPGKSKPRTEPSVDEGRKLTHALGCLACHSVADAGSRRLFGGGDLTRIAEKRRAEFFEPWLADPTPLNARHRMPVFALSPLERADMAVYLASLKRPGQLASRFESSPQLLERGARLYAEYRCAACHAAPAQQAVVVEPVRQLWGALAMRGCLATGSAERRIPSFGFTPDQIHALRDYFAASHASEVRADDGAMVLAQRNCLGCHARDAAAGIAPQLSAVAGAVPELGPLLPTLIPPALSGVGDKLHEDALQAALELKHSPRRPWLQVRMPKFKLSTQEVAALNTLFVNHDRVPAREPGQDPPLDAVAKLAAQRLVTADGFGCTSCHKIGNSEPVKVPSNARGTDLTMLGDRIRKSWFDRWVRNPARMIPRMEMPAIQKPVRGVLHDNVDEQLSAVWRTLNTPGFDPPPPNPVRVVRATNQGDRNERAAILTDVIEVQKQIFLRPLVVGLPNRHSVLFDLERGGIAAWWLGDVGRERTRGKSWYWESGSPSLWNSLQPLAPELRSPAGEPAWQPITTGQFRAELDQFGHIPQGVEWTYRLRFSREREERTLQVVERVESLADNGFRRKLALTGLQVGETVVIPLTPQDRATRWQRRSAQDWTPDEASPNITIRLLAEDERARLETAAEALCLTVRGDERRERFYVIEYRSGLPADKYHPVEIKLPPQEPLALKVVPGFEAVQLPLPTDEMPTGLAWNHRGQLFFTSLKGRLCTAIDTDGDGLEDRSSAVSDDFAAPYGLYCLPDAIDVINKYALLRLRDLDGDGFFELNEVLADDWGYTTDYHDWAVGLPRDAAGNYYVALPCQQDNRSAAAAHRRGTTIRLQPIARDSLTRRSFQIEHFTAGHRFPMGMAINREQAIFVTDNQGNYTPFNELNHLRPSQRYGFINKLEVRPDFHPPFALAAIQIPHPWTRSVNGICFLYTPVGVRERLGHDLFGPFEGHLIGCEFNGLSLVRMSLEKINDTYQGAVYPFSIVPDRDATTFEGPVVCEVGPSGELYVGNVRDSGWGGGQNTGSIVRLRPTGSWPLGIAEVRARATGFVVQFTGQIDPAKAMLPGMFQIRSYRRLATPAYGGNDVDERSERIVHVELDQQRQQVVLTLNALRPEYVYEIRVGAIGAGDTPLHPAEAHYTLLQIPVIR